jgi:hypothetical protein
MHLVQWVMGTICAAIESLACSQRITNVAELCVLAQQTCLSATALVDAPLDDPPLARSC